MARRDEESKENLETIANGAPADKYQQEQQIAKSTGFKVDAGETQFKPQKAKSSGSSLKQEVAASVIKDASMGGSLSGDGGSFGGSRSSGSVGGILGAANATPVAGKARSESRISKKLDRNSTKLNFIPSDTVFVDWDESKPLAESQGKQGFNGTYRNEYARSQKKVETVPGALMFDRSVDLLVKDNLYFGQGQMIKQSGVNSKSDITVTLKENYGIWSYDNDNSYTGAETGNYLLNNVEFAYAKNGKLLYLSFNETDLTPVDNQYVVNKSGAQFKILLNDAELVRETIDSKAGDEKADIWSPLARAVKQPTQLVGFLRDLEAQLGNEVLTAYRKFSTSMAFQLNRAHKDGQRNVEPAIFANAGLSYNFVSSEAQDTELGTDLHDALFNPDAYCKGAASTMIALYDSVAKYNTKADFILQPRSYRLHLQTADNNMDPLKVSKLFDQVYTNQETFSTIDREYDPMAPVCMTDKAGVIHKISMHKQGTFYYDKFHVEVTKVKVDPAVADLTDVFEVLPTNIVNTIKEAGKIINIAYPHEASGDIDNYDTSTGALSGDITYEFANGKLFAIVLSDQSLTFSTTKQYRVGDIVVYSGKMYTCVTDHLGSWSAGDFAYYLGATVETDAFTIANTDIVADAPLTFECHNENISDETTYTYSFSKYVIDNNAIKCYPYKAGPLKYAYEDLRNNYIVTVEDPLTCGIAYYLDEIINDKYHSLVGSKKVTIPAVHSTMFFSLWSIILCAATPYIINKRVNSFRDVLYYEKNVEYPFSSTLVSIKDCLTKAYSNFKYINYDTELEVGRMLPTTALSWMLPEMYQQVGYGSSESKVLCPWYSCQNEIRYLNGSYTWDDDASAMCFPSIRSGVRLAALDNLYGMTEEDVRLSIDKISSFEDLNPTLANSKTYKYSTVGDGQLVLSVDPAVMTAVNILKLPRELGFFVTAPYGVLTPTYAGQFDMNQSVLGTSSFRCYYWFGDNPITTPSSGGDTILNSVAINVNRAANFTQKWYCVLASGSVPPVDHGFYLSMNHAFSTTGALVNGKTEFKPFTTLADNAYGVSGTNMNYMRSMQKYLWTRIQKLPFILSPFDGLSIDNSDNPNNVIVSDPYDFLYCFGLGGFRASDFRESVYDREKQVVNQGILFVSDPWVELSPIFKEGAITSGVKTTKGFEL